MYENLSNIDYGKNNSPKIRGAESQDINRTNPYSDGIPGRGKEQKRTQPERISGTDSEAANGTARSIVPNGIFDEKSCIKYCKKLTSRLELVESEILLLREDYKGYTNSHRDRLLKRLVDNEQFARDIESKETDITQRVESLKKDLLEFTRVLGASQNHTNEITESE